MTSRSAHWRITLAAALAFSWGCEKLAPLQPLPDSGTDAAITDGAPDADGSVTDRGGDLGGDRDGAADADSGPDVGDGGTPDATPDISNGGKPDTAPDTGDGDGGMPDLAPDTGDGDGGMPETASDTGGGMPDTAPDSGEPPDASDDSNGDRGGDEAGTPVITCDPSMPFGGAIPVYGLNRDLGAEQHVNLSPDELTAYLSIGHNSSVADIYTARRDSTMQPFGSPTPIAAINSIGSELAVSVTGDGLALFFDSDRTGPRLIFTATRSTTAGAFESPRQLVLPSSQGQQLDPYVLPDGSAVYFTSTLPQYGLYRAALNATTADSPVQVMRGGNRFPVVSQDELTLYFAGNFNENFDILMATRSSRELPFGGPTTLTSLNTPDADEDPRWISPDGCRLYLTRTFPGEVAVSLVAERQRNQSTSQK